MRDLERLLIGAYPEGLRDVPPAPVRKSAVRDKTLKSWGWSARSGSPSPTSSGARRSPW